MSAYSIAIQRLVNHNWDMDFDLPLVLAVLRGPDEAKHDKLKETHTAPLRLYLIGARAYIEAGYHPNVNAVSRILPEIKSVDHFTNHIGLALIKIKNSKLPPFDES